MHTNIKTADRMLRIGAAGVMVVLVLAQSVGVVGAVAMSVAALALTVTGLSGFCPVYALLGINKEVTDEAATE